MPDSACAISELRAFVRCRLFTDSSMIRLLRALLVAVFALATSVGGAVAHHAVHCDATGSEGRLAEHDHGGHVALHAEVPDQEAIPLAADLGFAECSQHLCSVYISSVENPREQVAVPVANRPADTSISCLSRPESLYRPPDV
jgi:hypothetical protein